VVQKSHPDGLLKVAPFEGLVEDGFPRRQSDAVRFDSLVARHEEHPGPRTQNAEFLGERAASHQGHDHVCEQRVERVVVGQSNSECDLRMAGGEDRIARSVQHVLDHREDFRVVIDDEDRFFRGWHDVNLVQRSIAHGRRRSREALCWVDTLWRLPASCHLSSERAARADHVALSPNWLSHSGVR